MPEYLSPGVYIEEISTGPIPIEGVGTSTAGFVGQTERGPTLPRLMTSWLQYQRWYGSHIPETTSFLPYAVQGFFDNGGQRLFIARVTRSDAARAVLSLPASGPQTLELRAIGAGEWGNRVFVRVAAGSLVDPTAPVPLPLFRLTILYYRLPPPVPLVDPFDPANITNANRREPDMVEDYDNLTVDPEGGNYVVATLNGASKLLEIDDTLPPPDLPNNTAGPAFVPLTNGTDGAAPISATQYIGDPTRPVNQRRGLVGLEAIDEIAILSTPDDVHPSLNAANQTQLTNEVVNQCERLRDRFAVLNVPAAQGDVTTIRPPRDSTYAAIYYPWIRVFNPFTQDTLLVPPSGHVVGIYARTDVERGVHKAPANAEVRGIITRDLAGDRGPLEFKLTKGEHDILNPRGVNVIRDFRTDRRGIRVWGARTISSDAEWKYVNVRRLFIFVEESIDEGTQWVVFEPNDEPTWARVRRSITNFLIRVWRSGALMGLTQEEAFFVKCDRTTMTQDDIDNGRLICYIGIAPVKPAEFVIFRISQFTIEAQQ